MSNKVIRPILPLPPAEYDQVYLSQLSRALENVINELRNPITGISSLPTASSISSLQVGDLYQDANGFVKIVRAEDLP